MKMMTRIKMMMITTMTMITMMMMMMVTMTTEALGSTLRYRLCPCKFSADSRCRSDDLIAALKQMISGSTRKKHNGKYDAG